MHLKTLGFSVVGSSITCLFAVIGAALELRAEDPVQATLSSWVKSQSDRGQLKVEFYDPGKPRAFAGWTEFEFRFIFQYDCQINWPQKKPRRGSVVLVPSFSKIEIPVTHRVELPKNLEGERWYEAVLGRHELEHVRVGSHPRWLMLSKHLMNKVKRIERTIENPDDVTREWVRKQIEGELTPRKNAIQSLVLDINRHIDKLTDHGATPLEDREKFFADLYLKENLDDMKFPYLSEVLDLINTREYLEARVQTREIDVVDQASGVTP